MEFKLKIVEPGHVKGNRQGARKKPGLNPYVSGKWRRESKKNMGENCFPGKKNPKLTDEYIEISRTQ